MYLRGLADGDGEQNVEQSGIWWSREPAPELVSAPVPEPEKTVSIMPVTTLAPAPVPQTVSTPVIDPFVKVKNDYLTLVDEIIAKNQASQPVAVPVVEKPISQMQPNGGVEVSAPVVETKPAAQNGWTKLIPYGLAAALLLLGS